MYTPFPVAVSVLQRQLYRSLLRQGIKFDRNPRMKALLFTDDALFPASADEVPHALNHDDFVATELTRLVRQNCTYGMLYKPQRSVAELVRESFREPSLILGVPELNQLSFLALRRLFSCEAIAKQLTVVQKDSFCELTHGRDSLVKPITSAEVGSILVSHPLQTDRDLSNSLILVTHIRGSSSSGISLNRQCGDFKSQLTRKECIQYGSFLKPFYSMPCFQGGAGRISKKRKINFAILHQQESLASISERIELPGGSAANKKGKNHLYLSYNFQAISREIVEGRIKTSDLKVNFCLPSYVLQQVYKIFLHITCVLPSIRLYKDAMTGLAKRCKNRSSRIVFSLFPPPSLRRLACSDRHQMGKYCGFI